MVADRLYVRLKGGRERQESRNLQSPWLTCNAPGLPGMHTTNAPHAANMTHFRQQLAATNAPQYRQENMTLVGDIMDIKHLRNKVNLTAGHQHGNRSQPRGNQFVSRQSNWGTAHLPPVRSESTPPATRWVAAPRAPKTIPGPSVRLMNRGDSSGVGGCTNVGYHKVKMPSRTPIHFSERKKLPNEMTGWTTFTMPGDHNSFGSVPFDKVKPH